MQNQVNNQIFRQGDVLVQRVDTPIPQGAEKVKLDAGRVVLAYGEVTGHAHAIPGKLASMYTWQGDTLLEVRKPTALTHEEHAPIPLEPGTYRVVRQREYHPEELRFVAD